MTRTLCILAVLILAFTPAAVSRPASAPCRADQREAILRAEEGRAIHESWIAYIRAGYATPQQIAIGGDSAWHQRWADIYTNILAVLAQARVGC